MKFFAALILISAVSGCAINGTYPETSDVSGVARCKVISESEIAALFDRWNQSLQTGDPDKVVANYATRSILLPTLSNKPRLTPAEKEDYFQHFLEGQPSGKIDFRFIELGCNSAVDAGLYTFTFRRTGVVVHARYTYTYRWDGKQWLITSHHSSAMPEKM
ncbi:DUF4440 domain-containing protein [Collimonas arenae]|uniref:DUF4440 domain-containing protein n=1 Tax=Collimonas arenae TaxID=279058 RepID=UPI000572005B|nr:DUF4440 domain-containing protein [Collimonas arenae]